MRDRAGQAIVREPAQIGHSVREPVARSRLDGLHRAATVSVIPLAGSPAREEPRIGWRCQGPETSPRIRRGLGVSPQARATARRADLQETHSEATADGLADRSLNTLDLRLTPALTWGFVVAGVGFEPT